MCHHAEAEHQDDGVHRECDGAGAVQDVENAVIAEVDQQRVGGGVTRFPQSDKDAVDDGTAGVGDVERHQADHDAEDVRRVVQKFPKLTVIGAHFAGWSLWDRAVAVLEGTSIYTDCSSSLYALSPEHAAELIAKFGADRVLWGTDYPMWSSKEELERFDKIPISEEEKSLILYKNALRLLGESY